MALQRDAHWRASSLHKTGSPIMVVTALWVLVCDQMHGSRELYRSYARTAPGSAALRWVRTLRVAMLPVDDLVGYQGTRRLRRSLLQRSSATRRSSKGSHQRPDPTAVRPSGVAPRKRPAVDAEFISVEEFARRIGVSRQSAYRAIYRDEVPGVFRLGRRVTINWPAFVAKTYEAA
jgi:predicted DNA-binding transcriptional regulator AlpA